MAPFEDVAGAPSTEPVDTDAPTCRDELVEESDDDEGDAIDYIGDAIDDIGDAVDDDIGGESDASDKDSRREGDASDGDISDEGDANDDDISGERDADDYDISGEFDANDNDISGEGDASDNDISGEGDIGDDDNGDEGDASDYDISGEGDASGKYIVGEGDTSDDDIADEGDDDIGDEGDDDIGDEGEVSADDIYDKDDAYMSEAGKVGLDAGYIGDSDEEEPDDGGMGDEAADSALNDADQGDVKSSDGQDGHDFDKPNMGDSPHDKCVNSGDDDGDSVGSGKCSDDNRLGAAVNSVPLDSNDPDNTNSGDIVLDASDMGYTNLDGTKAGDARSDCKVEVDYESDVSQAALVIDDDATEAVDPYAFHSDSQPLPSTPKSEHTTSETATPLSVNDGGIHVGSPADAHTMPSGTSVFATFPQPSQRQTKPDRCTPSGDSFDHCKHLDKTLVVPTTHVVSGVKREVVDEKRTSVTVDAGRSSGKEQDAGGRSSRAKQSTAAGGSAKVSGAGSIVKPPAYWGCPTNDRPNSKKRASYHGEPSTRDADGRLTIKSRSTGNMPASATGVGPRTKPSCAADGSAKLGGDCLTGKSPASEGVHSRPNIESRSSEKRSLKGARGCLVGESKSTRRISASVGVVDPGIKPSSDAGKSAKVGGNGSTGKSVTIEKQPAAHGDLNAKNRSSGDNQKDAYDSSVDESQNTGSLAASVTVGRGSQVKAPTSTFKGHVFGGPPKSLGPDEDPHVAVSNSVLKVLDDLVTTIWHRRGHDQGMSKIVQSSHVT